MIPNPIRKVLSSIQTHRVRALVFHSAQDSRLKTQDAKLLTGGQACVFYGAAEFSRDTALALLANAANLSRLRAPPPCPSRRGSGTRRIEIRWPWRLPVSERHVVCLGNLARVRHTDRRTHPGNDSAGREYLVIFFAGTLDHRLLVRREIFHG